MSARGEPSVWAADAPNMIHGLPIGIEDRAAKGQEVPPLERAGGCAGSLEALRAAGEKSLVGKVLIDIANPQSPDDAGRAIAALATSAEYSGKTGRFYRDGKEIELPTAATSEELRSRLWEISEELAGWNPERT